MATAHPAKFPEAVQAALGHPHPMPAQLSPPELADLENREEHYQSIVADLHTVEEFIAGRVRD
jgi:threonine synthase